MSSIQKNIINSSMSSQQGKKKSMNKIIEENDVRNK